MKFNTRYTILGELLTDFGRAISRKLCFGLPPRRRSRRRRRFFKGFRGRGGY